MGENEERAREEWKRARYERQPEEKMTWVDLKLLHWGVKLPVRATTRDLYRAHVHFSYEELFCCFFCPLTNDLHSFIHISLVEISVLFSASAQPLTRNTYEHFSYIRSYVWAVRRLIKLFYFSSSLEVLSLFFFFPTIVSANSNQMKSAQYAPHNEAGGWHPKSSITTSISSC